MADIFICHASEDKEEVARPLAKMLVIAGLEVWYDEYSLKLGDSLRRTIDKGLAKSRFGAVILSPSFFEKDWPQTELDGLFAKEIGREKVILPIWHEIEKDEVLDHSPILADRYAARTSLGIDSVVMEILDVVAPDASHKTMSGLTVSVLPSEIRLYSDEWAIKTPLMITNLSDDPVYSVQIELELDPPDLAPGSIHVDLGYPTTRIEEPISVGKVSADAILFYFEKHHGQKSLVISLHTIPPHTSREIQVAGTKAIRSSASVNLWDFKTKTPEVLRKGSAVAFPFTVAEEVKPLGIALLIKNDDQ